MRSKHFSTLRFFLYAAAVSACLVRCANADQVGIDKVRLLEQPRGQYILEVDTLPPLVAAYRNPVLPGRFELTETRRERQPGYLVLRYQFRSRGDSLSAEDEILLPWGRAGASITAQWSDGTVSQNLILRDFEGIRVPIRLLRPSLQSSRDLTLANLQAGLKHGVRSWSHWVLVVSIGLLAVGWWRIGLLLVFAAGQAVSLVFVELGAIVVPPQAAEVLVAVVALLIARAGPLEAAQCRRFSAVMLILGVLHGLANARLLLPNGMHGTDAVQLLFWFNLGGDLFQIVATIAVSFLAIVFGQMASPRIRWLAQTGVGGCAVAVLLIASTTADPLLESAAGVQDATGQFELPGAQMVAPGTGSRPQPPRASQQPVASFLTIEPFEVRLEVLVQLPHMGNWLQLPPAGETLQAEQQDQVKQQLIDLIDERTSVQINGRDTAPTVQNTDFVTVEPNGIYSRPSPVPEPIDDAVVGITLVYDTQALADEVQLTWSLFADMMETVPATVTDPFGGRKQVLSAEDSQLTWKNQWIGYQPPEIKPVSVSKLRLPLLSVSLMILAGGVYWLFARGNRRPVWTTVTLLLLIVAMIVYPFVRVSVAAPLSTAWKPSAEQAAGILGRLLTNVYRAYDLRDEEAIYDRLALTITGEQLSEIYLDTRRSLELENRGGARARVDSVEILSVDSVEPAENGGLDINVSWTVGGSVTHFGHTHYRRNLYEAVVTIVPTDEHWKIQAIRLEKQQRLL